MPFVSGFERDAHLKRHWLRQSGDTATFNCMVFEKVFPNATTKRLHETLHNMHIQRLHSQLGVNEDVVCVLSSSGFVVIVIVVLVGDCKMTMW